MTQYVIRRELCGGVKWMTRNGGWSKTVLRARQFPSFLEAQKALRKRSAEILRVDAALTPTDPAFKVCYPEPNAGHHVIDDSVNAKMETGKMPVLRRAKP